MTIVTVVLLLILGCCFASFLNVLAGGSGDLWENLKRQRSVCDSCKNTLRWWELVPVFSWIALGGVCARCGARIPIFHMLSELLLGIVFALTYWFMMPYSTLEVALALLFVVSLYFFGVYDVFHRAVRNKYLFPVLIAVFLGKVFYSIVIADVTPLLSSAGGALWYFFFFALVNVLCERGLLSSVSKGKQGFGRGDVKYGVLLGLVLGWPVSFVGLWAGVFLGGFVSLVFLLCINEEHETIPFVPFLSIGAWVALLWGNAIMELARNMIL